MIQVCKERGRRSTRSDGSVHSVKARTWTTLQWNVKIYVPLHMDNVGMAVRKLRGEDRRVEKWREGKREKGVGERRGEWGRERSMQFSC